MLPRFVTSTGSTRDASDEPVEIEDVRSALRMRGGRELFVGTGSTGKLCVTEDRERLSPRARTQLAFHEVASGRFIELDAEELYVFDLLTIELLPDAPGVNDVLYLYGTMHGPVPSTKPAQSDGQLAVTRGDLLNGLLDGVANAFMYAPDQHGARCVHALVPGDRAGAIEAGRGIVMVLPLVPDWVLECPSANDRVAGQVLYEVLGALRADLGISEPPLPVPSRALVEHKLVAAGWKIEGNEAVKRKGVFARDERRPLPREGTLDELVALTRQLITKVPESPSPEVAALRRRVGRPPAPARVVPVAPPPPAAPAPSPPTVPHSTARPHVRTDRAEWMKDFVDAHRTPSRPAPRVVAPARAATPDWMSDFDSPESDDDDSK